MSREPERAASDQRSTIAAAVRGAAVPSLAGLAFELSGLAWAFGGAAALSALAALAGDAELVSGAVGSGVPIPGPLLALALFMVSLPLILACARIGGGAARISIGAEPGGRDTTTLRSAWAEGRPLQVSAAGIWLQIFGMMASGTFVLLGPLVGLTVLVGPDTLGPFGVVLSGVALILTLAYAAELGALHQLALASLVRHERGVGSAVLHGWRLMRAQRGHSRRLATVEFGVRAAVLLAAGLASYLAGPSWGLLQLALLGCILGSSRCRAWSLAYPRFGGLAATAGGGET